MNTAVAPGTAKKNSQRLILTMTVLTNFISTFLTSSMNLSTPAISSEFAVGAGTVGWFITIYMLASAAFAVPFGRLADIYGRRRILVIGQIALCAASLLVVVPSFFPALLALRFLQGVGASMVSATNVAILSAAYPPGVRGRALGISISAAYVGHSAGPVVGGFLNHAFGWRSILVFIFLLSFAVLIAVVLRIPPDNRENVVKGKTREDESEIQGYQLGQAAQGSRIRGTRGARCTRDTRGAQGIRGTQAARDARHAREPFDLTGSVLFLVSLTLFMYGLSTFANGLAGKLCAAAGALLLALFIRYEFSVEYPVVNVGLFARSLGYTLSNLASMLNYSATYMISYVLSIYLQVVRGFNSQTAGLIMIVQPVMIALLAAKIGTLSDRHSPFRLASFGMLLCTAGLVCFSFLKENTPIWMIAANLALVGVGFSFFSSPNTNAIMSFVKPEEYGIASSLVATMRSIGYTSSMAGITLIISWKLGDVPLAEAKPSEIVSTMHTAFLIFAGVCLLGVWLSSKRKGGISGAAEQASS